MSRRSNSFLDLQVVLNRNLILKEALFLLKSIACGLGVCYMPENTVPAFGGQHPCSLKIPVVLWGPTWLFFPVPFFEDS